jgi:site-specific DNA-methyltransferase (adenine-specific)
MQQLGFKILNDIIWQKRNPPPNLSCRYFTHSTETILWAAKNKKSKHYFNYPLMKELNGGKQMKNVWIMGTPSKLEKRFGKHPTQKPVELLTRIILASIDEQGLVLDPFCGSSTTGVASVMLNRKYVGIDQDETYLRLSVSRIQEIIEQRDMFKR